MQRARVLNGIIEGLVAERNALEGSPGPASPDVARGPPESDQHLKAVLRILRATLTFVAAQLASVPVAGDDADARATLLAIQRCVEKEKRSLETRIVASMPERDAVATSLVLEESRVLDELDGGGDRTAALQAEIQQLREELAAAKAATAATAPPADLDRSQVLAAQLQGEVDALRIQNKKLRSLLGELDVVRVENRHLRAVAGVGASRSGGSGLNMSGASMAMDGEPVFASSGIGASPGPLHQEVERLGSMLRQVMTEQQHQQHQPSTHAQHQHQHTGHGVTFEELTSESDDIGALETELTKSRSEAQLFRTKVEQQSIVIDELEAQLKESESRASQASVAKVQGDADLLREIEERTKEIHNLQSTICDLRLQNLSSRGRLDVSGEGN